MEINYGFFHALASEKSNTPSDTAEDPGTDDQASVTTSYVSLHGTPTGDIASEEARSVVVERIPPRKEVPAGSMNSSEAFLATAAPEEDSLRQMMNEMMNFQKMMNEMEESTKRMNNEMEKNTNRLNNCFS